MKNPLRLILCFLATSAPSWSAPASKSDGHEAAHPPAVPKYTEESPLPKGWPQPGPYNQVVLKKYPAYRAAFTNSSKANSGFMTLFKHIKKNDIPMSSPVAMKLDEKNAKGVEMEDMAFIYQDQTVGKTGGDGDKVEVRDMPAQEALGYAWMGPRDDASTARARAAIDAELTKRGVKATGYRLLGYNSPFIPRTRQTHELQALIK